jgi:hypothetical protein
MMTSARSTSMVWAPAAALAQSTHSRARNLALSAPQRARSGQVGGEGVGRVAVEAATVTAMLGDYRACCRQCSRPSRSQ